MFININGPGKACKLLWKSVQMDINWISVRMMEATIKNGEYV